MEIRPDGLYVFRDLRTTAPLTTNIPRGVENDLTTLGFNRRRAKSALINLAGLLKCEIPLQGDLIVPAVKGRQLHTLRDLVHPKWSEQDLNYPEAVVTETFIHTVGEAVSRETLVIAALSLTGTRMAFISGEGEIKDKTWVLKNPDSHDIDMQELLEELAGSAKYAALVVGVNRKQRGKVPVYGGIPIFHLAHNSTKAAFPKE